MTTAREIMHSGVECLGVDETLAKAAFLSGPDGARELVAEHGGVLFHEDGEAEPVGPIELSPRYTVRIPAALLNGAAA